MAGYDKLASGLARSAYQMLSQTFEGWQSTIVRDLIPTLTLPTEGRRIGRVQMGEAAEIVERHLDSAPCVIHRIDSRTSGERAIGAVVLHGARRTLNGRMEDGTALSAQAVTFVFRAQETAIIVRHLGFDVFQHALQRFIVRGADRMPAADSMRDQELFGKLFGLILMTDVFARSFATMSVPAGRAAEMALTLPFGCDIALGRLVMIQPESGTGNLFGSEGCFWDASGHRRENGGSRRTVSGTTLSVVTEIKTHVPEKLLHPEQIWLRDAMNAWYRRHCSVLISAFDADYLFAGPVDQSSESVTAAAQELQTIVARDLSAANSSKSG